MPRWRIWLLALVATPLVLFGLTSAAWAIDTRSHRGEVVRNVVVGDEQLGGLDRAELSPRLEAIADRFAEAEVIVDAGDFQIRTTTADLGVAVDVPTTIENVLRAGREDPGPLPPLRWARSLLSDRVVPLDLRIDRPTAAATIQRLEADRRTAPVEPTLVASKESVRMVPGTAGHSLDVDAILRLLPVAATSASGTITIESHQRTEPPLTADATVEALARRAEEISTGKVTLQIGDKAVEVDATAFRPGFALAGTPEAPRLSLDPTVAKIVLGTVAPEPPNATGVRFVQGGGGLVPKAGTDAVVCCGPNAADQIVTGLLDGSRTIPLDTRVMTAAEGLEWASTLGVKQVVGEFTTRHPAGQPRVRNIHRIADLTRGVLIPPGETFSVNGFVGKRTAEKGFVPAPVIDEGEFKTDFGGGVSQYATTLFNAAFFAGLDIPEHKAHSIYISRYPFGREATLAYPSVDLKIRNNSPYGVVIWPTYTGSSITVQLWSTKYAVGSQTGANKTSGCGSVVITRSRLFVDGRTDSQRYRASYDCDPPEH